MKARSKTLWWWRVAPAMVAATALTFGLPSGPIMAGEATAAAARDSSKDAADLQKKADAAKKSVEETRTQLNEALGAYNGIVQGQDKDPRSSHKKLAKILDDVMKKRASNAGLWDQMQAKSADFFKAWETELGTITTESIRQVSQQRLDAAKARYEKLSTNLTAAREEYSKFLTNFQEQVTLMGRDLSPEAIAGLQAPAAELNAQSEAHKARAAEMMAVAAENRVSLTGQAPK